MKKKNQRGSILIFSTLILAVILGISMALIAVFVPKLRLLRGAASSTVAIFAADSASELCLYEARKQAIPVPLASPLMTNAATFTVASLSAPEQDVTGDCRPLGVGTFKFRATGMYQGISRSLEVTQ